MQVFNRLSALFSAVNNNPEPLFEFQLIGKFLNGSENGLESGSAGGLSCAQMGDVRYRYNKDMNRSLRLNIAKRHDVGVAVHDVRGDLSLNDFAEQAMIFHVRTTILEGISFSVKFFRHRLAVMNRNIWRSVERRNPAREKHE